MTDDLTGSYMNSRENQLTEADYLIAQMEEEEINDAP